MKTLVIGGTGHIGKFLTPMLVAQGAEVVVATRGTTPVPDAPAWGKAEVLTAEYARDDAAWRSLVTEIGAEVVIDIIGRDVPGTYQAARAHGELRHFIACGSVWMFGPPKVAPTPPVTQGPCESKGYAERYRLLQETLGAAARDGVAFTAIMPPNICGPGKIPLDCSGGRDLEVHKAHRQGLPVRLPSGCNTLIGPCDAEDIARCFCLATDNRDAATGEIFNVGSAYALTAPQFVRTYGQIYQSEIPIEFVAPDEYYNSILPDAGANYHFREHMLPDISKTRARLDYEPQYTSEETMQRAVDWMRREKLI